MSHRLLVLGATGATGRQIVIQALALGNAVTALSRHTDRPGIAHERLVTVSADVAGDDHAVARVLSGHDAVLSALGRGMTLRSGGLIERSMRRIVEAMERTGTRRLIFLSAFGVGESMRDAPWLSRLMYRVMLRGIYADKIAGEAILRRSMLDWTLVKPTMLTNRDGIEPYRMGTRLPLSGIPRISRASVADYMIRCVDDRGTVGKEVVLSG